MFEKQGCVLFFWNEFCRRNLLPSFGGLSMALQGELNLPCIQYTFCNTDLFNTASYSLPLNFCTFFRWKRNLVTMMLFMWDAVTYWRIGKIDLVLSEVFILILTEILALNLSRKELQDGFNQAALFSLPRMKGPQASFHLYQTGKIITLYLVLAHASHTLKNCWDVTTMVKFRVWAWFSDVFLLDQGFLIPVFQELHYWVITYVLYLKCLNLSRVMDGFIFGVELSPWTVD